MTSSISIQPLGSNGFGLAVAGSELLRTLPEPRNSWTKTASSLLSTGAELAGSVIPGADVLGVGGLESLLQMQIQIQQVMQYFSMQSNIEKSKHETEMAPIRNMRVG